MQPSRDVSFKSFGIDVNFHLPERDDDHIQKVISSSKNFYELDLLSDAFPRIGKRSVVVDVGANIGNHTIFFSKVCGAKVIAFEPYDVARERLLANVSLNGVEDLVEVHDAAVGAVTATGDVDVISIHNLGQTMVKRQAGDAGHVRIVKLDDVLAGRDIDLLKVDTEGMELEVVRGAEETIRRCKPIIYAEAQSPDKLVMLEQLLATFDYSPIDRFASTPTYLFAHVSDEKQRHLSLVHRTANINRDVKMLAASFSKIRSVQEQSTASIDQAKASIEQLSEAVGARARNFNGLAELEAANAEFRDTIFNLQNQRSKLQYERDAFRQKLEIIYESPTWEVATRLRVAFSKITRSKWKPQSAKQFFDRVAKNQPKYKIPSRALPKFSAVYPETRQLELSEANSKVFAGIAAIPARRAALEKTVASLLTQVDGLGVYLNGWDDVPEFLKDPKIKVVRSQEFGDIGDAGKFFWVDGHRGFYFSCDDDIIYPPYYVERLKGKLGDHGYRAAVGWHGSMIKGKFTSYYTGSSRRVFGFQHHRPWDTPVHILGTGCAAFHTDGLKVHLEDFPEPNMADVFFAILGQKQRVPFIVVAHEAGELVEVEGTQESSIQADSRSQANTVKDTGPRQTELIREVGAWRTFEWKPLRIGIIGRFNSYKKGGIYKSCNLIANSLRDRGHFVVVHDTHEPLTAVDSTLDLVWIYPGDPMRPDFATVDEKIEQLRAAGVPVLVNLSYLYEPERSKWIAEKLAEYNSRTELPPVLAAVFAESVIDDPALQPVKDFVVFVPKTIEPTSAEYMPDFHDREGICFGDSTKLSNKDIIGGSSVEWINAVCRRLPHVNLYAYKQYSGGAVHKHIQTVPHMTDGFGNFLAERRLFINLNVHLTFEMVGCEAQSYGTPLIYRHMPHSLSEYIGPTGIRVRSPEELGELAAWLYNDESAWREYSRASRQNGAAISYENAHAALEASLRIALVRVRSLQTGDDS
ncbi:FkbM family methyltransferase [Sinorhizobium medicae]|uniref:FkbM family methyltransferase n=1 Tax=Sinorhizobium medicae TaxID=110321 RepID=UPI001297E3E9|nr:FkbM family methyltransferase [Sinorhizobium medicae]MDX0548511.1 FkbM family methyltransferase [Sinorhizobium medicae]MDX0573729.1 FkbM family methyltransferase [Sinorhizobium medicae]MDX0672528.1 FkbM family methyltransferase [Sinorhizobium medicae]MDX0709936.1 FkbM family methyltransferase [Sinorhizobium medicae]MQX97983.1 FkbM family methyltransferase [Sinorhizobium medicae]